MISAKIPSALCLLGLTLILATIASVIADNSPEAYIAAHNAVRAEVGVGPLQWNATLADYAQTYANTKIATCKMESSEGPYGENLAKGSEQMTAEAAVTMWTNEKKYYNHDSNTCGNDPSHCLHYTQVVWKNTTSVGCAHVNCKTKGVLVICNYYPSGNYIGERPY